MTMTETAHTTQGPTFLTVQQVCKHLQVSRATLYRYMEDGLPSHRPAGPKGRRLFAADEVDAWVTSRCSDLEAGEDS